MFGSIFALIILPLAVIAAAFILYYRTGKKQEE